LRPLRDARANDHFCVRSASWRCSRVAASFFGEEGLSADRTAIEEQSMEIEAALERIKVVVGPRGWIPNPAEVAPGVSSRLPTAARPGLPGATSLNRLRFFMRLMTRLS